MDVRTNLSYQGRSLRIMTTSQTPDITQTPRTTDVFADPVTYLAEFGIESVLVAETTLPAAA